MSKPKKPPHQPSGVARAGEVPVSPEGRVSLAVSRLKDPTTYEGLFYEMGHEVRLTPEQELQLQALSPPQRLFLLAYGTAGTMAGAERMLHNNTGSLTAANASTHYKWKKQSAEYREAFEVIDELVTAAWDDAYQRVALEGLKETTYDENGDVRRTKVRQDAQILSRVVGSRIDKYRAQDKAGGVTVNITVERTAE